jgi:hypothetical protein
VVHETLQHLRRGDDVTAVAIELLVRARKSVNLQNNGLAVPLGLPHTKPIEYYAIVSPARSSSGGSCEAERGTIGQVQVLGASAAAAWLGSVVRV